MNDFDPELPADADESACEQWLRRIVQDFGPGFHPDTPATEYTDARGTRLSPAVAAALDSSLARAFTILGDCRPYEIGLEEQRKLLGFDGEC